jgi:hypothetical protein
MGKNKFVLIVVLCLACMLTACAADPRKEAEAYATRTQADQSAANQAQLREQSAELHALNMQHQEAVAMEWEAGLNKVIHAGALVGQYVFVLVLIAAGYGFSIAVVGTGKAWARFVEVRANLIRLDPVTRQYPAVLTYVSKGRYSLANLNNDSVLMLDTRNEPDRQMILGMSNTQYAGALARESRMSLQPGEVAGILAPFVEMANE